jgi:Family of unknown function (DUF5681)
MKKRNLNPKVPGNYEVGYCRPPQANQFKPGQTGNPKGRPKGGQSKGKGLLDLFDQIGDEQVEARIGDKTRKISRRELSVRQVYNNFAKGDARSLAMMIALETKRSKIKPEASTPGSGVLLVHPMIESVEEIERNLEQLTERQTRLKREYEEREAERERERETVLSSKKP